METPMTKLIDYVVQKYPSRFAKRQEQIKVEQIENVYKIYIINESPVFLNAKTVASINGKA